MCPVRTSPRKAALSIGPITFPIRLPTEKQVFIHKTMRGECFSFKQRIAKQVCVLNNEKYAFYRSVFQGVVYRLVSFRSLKSFGYVQWSRGYWFILISGNYWWVTKKKDNGKSDMRQQENSHLMPSVSWIKDNTLSNDGKAPHLWPHFKYWRYFMQRKALLEWCAIGTCWNWCWFEADNHSLILVFKVIVVEACPVLLRMAGGYVKKVCCCLLV